MISILYNIPVLEREGKRGDVPVNPINTPSIVVLSNGMTYPPDAFHIASQDANCWTIPAMTAVVEAVGVGGVGVLRVCIIDRVHEWVC